MATTSRSADLTSGPMLQKIILFSVPLAASSILQLLFNAADVVVVGRFAGSTALAAVGSNGSLINLLVNLFVGLSLGANVVAARCFGARDEKGVQDTVHTAVALGLVSGVLLAVVGFCAARGLLELMSCPEDVIGLSALYLKIYFIGMPMTMLYNFSSALLRAVGDTKRPLYCLAAAGIINVVLNLVFVIGFSMSVAGVALATIISQLASAMLTLRCLAGSQGMPWHLQLKNIRIERSVLLAICRIGLPGAAQSALYSISNMTIQSAINGFGTVAVAAWSVYGKIDFLFWMTVSSFGIAVTTFAGQNFGARQYDRVRRGTMTCLAMTAGTTLCISLALYPSAQLLFRLFSSDDAVVAQGVQMMHYLVPVYMTYICIEIFSGALRGCGDVRVPTIITVFAVCIMRIVWLAVALPFKHELSVVEFSYPLTWITATVLFAIYYTKGGWMQRCIAAQNAKTQG